MPPRIPKKIIHAIRRTERSMWRWMRAFILDEYVHCHPVWSFVTPMKTSGEDEDEEWAAPPSRSMNLREVDPLIGEDLESGQLRSCLCMQRGREQGTNRTAPPAATCRSLRCLLIQHRKTTDIDWPACICQASAPLRIATCILSPVTNSRPYLITLYLPRLAAAILCSGRTGS